ELLNTLERLRALQRQPQPPVRVANPARGGAPNGGGDPRGEENSRLTTDQVRAIGDEVRRCWTADFGAPGVEQMQVLLIVRTDESGVAHVADIAPQDHGRLGDPIFRAFAERARRAVLDPRCANLPLPRTMQGQRQVLTFRFRPGE
ncbi:MAG: hypothetical protein JO110_18175, partial [Acetobacteraceae bacterium]|nr:hypothetical protein [Acetobacteraceae bacterium]